MVTNIDQEWMPKCHQQIMKIVALGVQGRNPLRVCEVLKNKKEKESAFCMSVCVGGKLTPNRKYRRLWQTI